MGYEHLWSEGSKRGRLDRIVKALVDSFIEGCESLTASEIAERIPGASASVVGRLCEESFHTEGGWRRLVHAEKVIEKPCKSYGHMGHTTSVKRKAWTVTKRHLAELLQAER